MTSARIYKMNIYRVITMKRIIFLVCIFSLFIVLSWCGKTVDDGIISTGTVQWFTTSYLVWNAPNFQKVSYGTVVADSTKTILSNRGGILEYINCQPGMEVSKNTIIAKIQPNVDDPSYQNNETQLDALNAQLNTLSKIFSLTDDTFALQKRILLDQYDNNVQLLANLEKSDDYSTSNIDYQQQLLQQQYTYLQDAKSIDLNKMKTSVSTTYKQYLVVIKDALKKVDDVFGIDNTTSNVAFAQYISSKDPDLKTQVEQNYREIKDQLSDTMSASEFSQYILDVADFMTLAASSINASTPSTALPQAGTLWWLSIDGLYTTYTTLATTLLGSKSAFDGVASSYDSVKNTYNNQIKTADINTQNFEDTTIESTALQIKNQKASMQLAQKTLKNQITSADDTKDIQLANLKNQILTLRQNIAVISNSLDGEVLYAGVDGIVKMRAIGEDNKVTPNTLLCQILPQNPWNLSLQIFSYQQLPLWSKVTLSDDQWTFLGTWILVYEYPYRDPATQNYIYEIPVITLPLKENQKILVTYSQRADINQIWIPLQYVSPRLEGNLIRRKSGKTIQDIYVRLGNINDSYVEVLSWLDFWDEIVQ